MGDAMKYKPLFGKRKPKEKKKSMDMEILELDVKLRRLKDKYEVLLQRELLVARDNKKNGIRNSANYSKIGIVYYSLNIVEEAQKRLRDISSSRELYVSMNEMSEALSTLNELSGHTGKLRPDKLISMWEKIKAKDTGAGKDLLNTLQALSEAELRNEKDSVPMDFLVSKDIIEKLINGEDVNRCNVFSNFLENDEILDLPQDTVSSEDIARVTQNISELLNQI